MITERELREMELPELNKRLRELKLLAEFLEEPAEFADFLAGHSDDIYDQGHCERCALAAAVLAHTGANEVWVEFHGVSLRAGGGGPTVALPPRHWAHRFQRRSGQDERTGAQLQQVLQLVLDD